MTDIWKGWFYKVNPSDDSLAVDVVAEHGFYARKVAIISDSLTAEIESDNLNFGSCIHINDGHNDDTIISVKDWQSFKDAVDRLISDEGAYNILDAHQILTADKDSDVVMPDGKVAPSLAKAVDIIAKGKP